MRGAAIKCRGFVADGSGGYRPYEELNSGAKEAFGRELVRRMGEAVNRYASAHPEAIPCIIAAADGGLRDT